MSDTVFIVSCCVAGAAIFGLGAYRITKKNPYLAALSTIAANQQKTNELFVAIDVRLKAIEKKLAKRGKR